MNSKENKSLDESLKVIVKSSIITLIFILLSKLLTYAYRVIIAREFGPETYGLFSLSVMIVSWFIAISSLGLVDGIIRYISFFRGKGEKQKINYILRKTLLVVLISSFIAGIFLYFFAEFISISFFHNSDLIIYLKWLSIGIPLSILASVFLSVLQTFEKISWYSFIRNVLDAGVKLISILIFVAIGVNSKAIIFSYLLGILSMLGLSFLICKLILPEIFKIDPINSRIKKGIMKNLFSYSWPLMFLGILAFLFSWIDSFALGYFKTVKEVGIYNAAYPIATLLIIAPSLFLQLFFPIITKDFAQKKFKKIEEISKQVGNWVFMLNLPLVMIMILFPGALINLFFGPEYLLGEEALRFLAIGLFFYSISIISENLLSMAGKSKTILLNILIAAILNVLLNILLVPKYGTTGAAFATMITYCIWGFISLAQANYYVSIIPLRRKMIIALISIIIPTLLLFFLKNFILINTFTLILQGIFFFLSYVFILVLFKGFDKKDMMILKSIRKKIKL